MDIRRDRKKCWLSIMIYDGLVLRLHMDKIVVIGEVSSKEFFPHISSLEGKLCGTCLLAIAYEGNTGDSSQYMSYGRSLQ